jgi:hypothetical protein
MGFRHRCGTKEIYVTLCQQRYRDRVRALILPKQDRGQTK